MRKASLSWSLAVSTVVIALGAAVPATKAEKSRAERASQPEAVSFPPGGSASMKTVLMPGEEYEITVAGNVREDFSDGSGATYDALYQYQCRNANDGVDRHCDRIALPAPAEVLYVRVVDVDNRPVPVWIHDRSSKRPEYKGIHKYKLLYEAVEGRLEGSIEFEDFWTHSASFGTLSGDGWTVEISPEAEVQDVLKFSANVTRKAPGDRDAIVDARTFVKGEITFSKKIKRGKTYKGKVSSVRVIHTDEIEQENFDVERQRLELGPSAVFSNAAYREDRRNGESVKKLSLTVELTESDDASCVPGMQFDLTLAQLGPEETAKLDPSDRPKCKHAHEYGGKSTKLRLEH